MCLTTRQIMWLVLGAIVIGVAIGQVAMWLWPAADPFVFHVTSQ